MRHYLIILAVFLCASAYAQSEATTFILVRHAEKENIAADQAMAKDPPLSKEGQERAQSFGRLLEKQKVDAIFSTNYNRTKGTIQPVATANNVEIQMYQTLNVEELISKYKGKTVVICGHSNTIPQIANALLGTKHFAGNYDESDYGNILIITVTPAGKSMTHLRY